MKTITKIVDTCTVKLSEKWKWGEFVGENIRIAGLYPPPKGTSSINEIKRMEQELIGRNLEIKFPYLVELGSTLVARVEIGSIELNKLFIDRYKEMPIRERYIDTSIPRVIRKVRGKVKKKWDNPVRTIETEDFPYLDNSEIPRDVWVPDYSKRIDQIKKIFCEDRKKRKEDIKSINDFINSRRERIYVLFGDCGCGKSWFTRWHLIHNLPKEYDLGIIDAASFRNEDPNKFEDKIHIQLDNILTYYVNKPGLLNSLKGYLEPRVHGIYPHLKYSDDMVESWCLKYIEQITLPSNKSEFNFIRLDSYRYSGRYLMLLVDNIDAQCPIDQGELFELIVNMVLQFENIFLVIPLRPSGDFYYERLNTRLQHHIKRHTLSHINPNALIKIRIATSLGGKDIFDKEIKDDSNPEDIYITSLRTILGFYEYSSAAKPIDSISQGDVRHYIRLFRRHLCSDKLRSLKYIGNEYYCLSTLMLKPDDAFKPETSFIINVFDNDCSYDLGNTLIRWRVLEYFLSGYRKCFDRFFEYYFERLGYTLQRVKEVLKLWENAGAIEIFDRPEGVMGYPTKIAWAYRIMIFNLQYCIVVKTGMNIDDNYILKNEYAQKEAKKYGFNIPQDAEWVSDDGFLSFIGDEESLEELNVQKYTNKNNLYENQIGGRGPISLHKELWYSHAEQRRKIEKSRKKTYKLALWFD